MSYFPHIAVWRIGEAILIIQAPTHHAAAVGYKCIQGMKDSASLIDRPALAAEEWTSVADYYTRIKEYCLNPMEVLESKGYQREMFPFENCRLDMAAEHAADLTPLGSHLWIN
jgi:hypothetical protein